MGRLGDAGISNSDALYNGDTGDSAFTVQYYRDKAREFQDILNRVDATARAAQTVIDSNIDAQLSDGLIADLQDFDAKKALFRGTAEAINAGAALLNSVGGRFPQLSIPSGLGLVPLVIPAATIAAIGVAAGLIVWGSQWVAGVVQRMETAQLLSVGTPEQQAELARQMSIARNAAIANDESPLQSISGLVKWGAIAYLAMLAFQAFSRSKYAR